MLGTPPLLSDSRASRGRIFPCAALCFPQAVHIFLWISCGSLSLFPQIVENLRKLWITFFGQRPYHNKKKPCIQGFFRRSFSCDFAAYPQLRRSFARGYPQYPVVAGQSCPQSAGKTGIFPSFFARAVQNRTPFFSSRVTGSRRLRRAPDR